MVVEDGVVKEAHVEPDNTGLDGTCPFPISEAIDLCAPPFLSEVIPKSYQAMDSAFLLVPSHGLARSHPGPLTVNDWTHVLTPFIVSAAAKVLK